MTSLDFNMHLTDIILMSYTGHMDIGRHVQAIQSDLAAAAALGDEATAAAGERLAAAVDRRSSSGCSTSSPRRRSGSTSSSRPAMSRCGSPGRNPDSSSSATSAVRAVVCAGSGRRSQRPDHPPPAGGVEDAGRGWPRTAKASRRTPGSCGRCHARSSRAAAAARARATDFRVSPRARRGAPTSMTLYPHLRPWLRSSVTDAADGGTDDLRHARRSAAAHQSRRRRGRRRDLGRARASTCS